MMLETIVTQYRERIEELEEENRQLKEYVYRRDWEAPEEFGLTCSEAQILSVLVWRNRWVSKELVIEATRGAPGSRSDYMPDVKVADVWICKLRSKMRPFGLEIETVWGRGWRLTQASQMRLRKWSREEVAA